MPQTVTPGQVAYEVYGMCRSHLSLLVWEAQTPEMRATWEAVAAAVLAHAARRLPVRQRGAAVCAVCSATLEAGVVYCPNHPEAQVFILLEETAP